MNALIVGSQKDRILSHIPEGDFLLIDDGPLIDRLRTHQRPRRFEVKKHRFNPLKDMDYRTACDFIAVLDAVFPEGQNTLTRAASNVILLEALMDKPTRLDALISDSKDPYVKDAYRKIRRLLLSPVLKRVLNGSGKLDFSFEGTIVARIDRAELGRFDAFVLGNLLINAYRGQVVVPDFDFYATSAHEQLIHEERLIAGITSFDRVPALKDELILMEPKIAARCTYDDALVLARHAGLRPDPMREDNEYNRFIEESIS